MPNRIRIVRGLMTIALLTGALAGLAGRIHSDARAADADRSATPSAMHTATPFGTPPATRTPIPGGAPVVINEIAWAGTGASAGDEWIELVNRRDYPVDLSGWTLRARDGEPIIHLSGTIPAHGFFLLERGDDQTVSNLRADLIYQGALSDVGERLFLYDRSRNLVDHANAFSDTWLAGDLSRHRSMERIKLLSDTRTSWDTHHDVVENGLDAKGRPIHGTPGRRNSLFLTSPTSTPSSGDLPDLRVVGMKIDYETYWCWPAGGSPRGLWIWVFNGGQVGAHSFVVSMENEQDSGEKIILELGARGYSRVFFPHPYWDPPLVRAEVDSTGLVRESYEGNNILIQLVPIYMGTQSLPCTTGTPSLTPTLTPHIGGSQPAK